MQVERGGETQVRAMDGRNKRAGKELIGWKKNTRNRSDAEQVWRERRITGELDDKRGHRQRQEVESNA